MGCFYIFFSDRDFLYKNLVDTIAVLILFCFKLFMLKNLWEVITVWWPIPYFKTSFTLNYTEMSPQIETKICSKLKEHMNVGVLFLHFTLHLKIISCIIPHCYWADVIIIHHSTSILAYYSPHHISKSFQFVFIVQFNIYCSPHSHILVSAEEICRHFSLIMFFPFQFNMW